MASSIDPDTDLRNVMAHLHNLALMAWPMYRKKHRDVQAAAAVSAGPLAAYREEFVEQGEDWPV